MSAPGNAVKLGTAKNRPWLGANLQCISQHTTESAHSKSTKIDAFQQKICSYHNPSNKLHTPMAHQQHFHEQKKKKLLPFTCIRNKKNFVAVVKKMSFRSW